MQIHTMTGTQCVQSTNVLRKLVNQVAPFSQQCIYQAVITKCKVMLQFIFKNTMIFWETVISVGCVMILFNILSS